jgi:hypothetical protein
MMIDRRTFMVQGVTLLATAPALAIVLPSASTAQTPFITVDGADENFVVFKIDGWDHCEAKASNENEVRFRMNQSWRAAWR